MRDAEFPGPRYTQSCFALEQRMNDNDCRIFANKNLLCFIGGNLNTLDFPGKKHCYYQ
jgi:hypothetical protein